MDLVPIDLVTLKAEKLRILPSEAPSESFAALLDERPRSDEPRAPEPQPRAEPEPMESGANERPEDDMPARTQAEPESDAEYIEAPRSPKDDAAQEGATAARDGDSGQASPAKSAEKSLPSAANAGADAGVTKAGAEAANDAARAIGRPTPYPATPQQAATAPSIPIAGPFGDGPPRPPSTPAAEPKPGGEPGRPVAVERPEGFALQRSPLDRFTGPPAAQGPGQQPAPTGKATVKHPGAAKDATHGKGTANPASAAAGPADAGRTFTVAGGSRAGLLWGTQAQIVHGARGPAAQTPGLPTAGAGLTAPRVPSFDPAASPPRPATTTSAPADQIAVHIRKAAAQGQDRISIRLQPADLGRIEVKLEWRDDGLMRAAISAEKNETLELLQRDARALERALQDAGLKTDSGSLSFNLRGQGGRGRGDDADQPSAEQGGQGAATAASTAHDDHAAGWRAVHHGLLDLRV